MKAQWENEKNAIQDVRALREELEQIHQEISKAERVIGEDEAVHGVSDAIIRARDQVMKDLRRHFRPEFLNRVDDIILFKPLTTGEIGQIVDLLIEDLRKRLEDRRINLELTPNAKEYVAKKGYDPVYGARPLKRFLQRHVETLVGRALIGGEILDGASITIDLKDGKLNLDWENA